MLWDEREKVVLARVLLVRFRQIVYRNIIVLFDSREKKSLRVEDFDDQEGN